VALAVVHDLREARAQAGPDELAAFETDTLAGLVLARAAAGLADSTIAGEVIHLEQVRAWLGRPLWTMQPADADAYFGQVLHGAARGTRLARPQALKTYFLFLELRHKVEIHQVTGHVVACPVDEVNRPRGGQDAALRIPPSESQVGTLFAGWRGELAECRKFAPAARNYAAARLMAEVGLRVNEACQLDLDDVKWGLGRFGKIHVRMGKGARGSGPRERMVPLINNARATLEWFVQDVWGHFDDDHTRPGAPLLPSERRNPDGTCARVGAAGLYCAEAGVELLIGQGSWLRRDDFTGPFIAVTPGQAGQAAVAVIGWDAAVAALDGGALPCSSGERRILHLAASIAAGIPADLGEALTGLDRAGIAAAARAVLHAGGHRDAMVTLPPGIPPHLRRKGER
jgi:integrase